MSDVINKKREEYKDVEIDGRKWRINKFTAFDGSYVFFRISSLIGPIISKQGQGQEIDYSAITNGLTSLGRDGIKEMQTISLKACSEKLDAGFTPVLSDNDTFGVIGLEKNAVLVLKLTAQVVMFNMQDFFSEIPSLLNQEI
jgi:hypothetical protein